MPPSSFFPASLDFVAAVISNLFQANFEKVRRQYKAANKNRNKLHPLLQCKHCKYHSENLGEGVIKVKVQSYYRGSSDVNSDSPAPFPLTPCVVAFLLGEELFSPGFSHPGRAVSVATATNVM